MAYAVYNVVLKNNTNNEALDEISNPSEEEKDIKDNNIKLSKWIGTIATTSMLTANVINSKVGQYTGNKVAQSNASQAIKLAGLASAAILSIASGNYIGGAIAIGGAAISYGSQLLDYTVMVRNSEQESAYKRSLRGNMATSNSRWRGDYK